MKHMSILLSKTTQILIQGITGKEGRRAGEAMLAYHTAVMCGVTPGKGGQSVRGLPVFNSVAEAKAVFPDLEASAVYVPPAFAKAAVLESISSGLKLINVITERIPIQDTAYFLAAARSAGARLVGPASVGMIAPGIGRIGMIGGPNPEDIYTPGPVGVISRSGAMTNELSWMMRQAGLGQSTAVGIGGDLLIGTTYGDLLLDFEKDPQTKAIAIFGEMGGRYEYEIVNLRKAGRITKPVAIFIGGKFGAKLPEGTALGHAGAIIEKGRGSVADKEQELREAGIMVAEEFYDLPQLIKEHL